MSDLVHYNKEDARVSFEVMKKLDNIVSVNTVRNRWWQVSNLHTWFSLECNTEAGMGLGLIVRCGFHNRYVKSLPRRAYLDLQVTLLAWTLVWSFAWDQGKLFTYHMTKYANLATDKTHP